LFTIMICVSKFKRELRAIRHDAIFTIDHRFHCEHHSGVPWTLELPPGVASFDALPRFDTVKAAEKSIDDDYCPSLHP
jgi:hypothetical protein